MSTKLLRKQILEDLKLYGIMLCIVGVFSLFINLTSVDMEIFVDVFIWSACVGSFVISIIVFFKTFKDIFDRHKLDVIYNQPIKRIKYFDMMLCRILVTIFINYFLGIALVIRYGQLLDDYKELMEILNYILTLTSYWYAFAILLIVISGSMSKFILNYIFVQWTLVGQINIYIISMLILSYSYSNDFFYSDYNVTNVDSIISNSVMKIIIWAITITMILFARMLFVKRELENIEKTYMFKRAEYIFYGLYSSLIITVFGFGIYYDSIGQVIFGGVISGLVYLMLILIIKRDRNEVARRLNTIGYPVVIFYLTWAFMKYGMY